MLKMGESLININFGGLLTIQIILLIIHYGGFANLPKWLVFLPLIIIGSIIGIILIIFFIVVMVWILSEVF
jgi:hypothetical protein